MRPSRRHPSRRHPSRRRRDTNRVSRFESVEPRLFLSGDPIADFWLDYYVESQFNEEVRTTLADAHELTGLSYAREEFGFTGTGQTVAVIDSGIAYDHYALGGGMGAEYKVVGGFDFTDERDGDPYDDGPYGSHGTHVAGIIGGDNGDDSGVAPGADLVGLRVFDDDGHGYFHWVEEALQWVHDNRFAFENPITTVNLSLGANWNSDAVPSWAMLEDEFAQLNTDGIFVSVAAGNSFTSYDEPGLSYPAVSPYVVPVASVDDDGTLSYFSQRAEHVIAAPGRGILSSVPDYVGDHNGVADDFARYSGTSMAAPYVAGAGVLLREAYAFVGQDDVDQQAIYDLMVSSADTVFDPDTGLNYHRLNLQQAIEVIMPADDFGSTAAAAHNLGTVDTTDSLSGTIGSLNDFDWFSFTAGSSGSVTLQADTTGNMLAQWQLDSASQGVWAKAVDSGDLTFDVVSGQSYTVGLTTGGGLGHYTLDVNLDSASSQIDWGTVGQENFDGYQIDGEQDFAVTAADDGLLTVEAFFDHAAGDVDLQLYDGAGQLVGSSASTGGHERIDVTAAAGETFHLKASVYGGGTADQVDFRVTNLVAQSGETVTVAGTAAADVIRFSTGSTHQLTINGVEYAFDSATVRTIAFDGRGGSDRATLHGTEGSENVVLRAGSGELTGGAFNVTATGVETLTVWAGGGSDKATFHDSAGNDTFVATPGYGGMFGTGISNQVIGVEEVVAYAYNGGYNAVKLYDSAGNDTFVATSGYGGMMGPGFANHTRGFDAVHAFATAGGSDKAKLYDSAGDDTFNAGPIQASMHGSGFYNRAKFFEQVHAFATAGGNDTARFYDSAGDDVFVGTAVDSALYGTGFFNRAKFFEQVHAEGGAGGEDRSYLYDSAGNDRLGASADRAWLSAGNTVTWLYGFEYIRAQSSNGGIDTADIAAVDYVLELDGDWS